MKMKYVLRLTVPPTCEPCTGCVFLSDKKACNIPMDFDYKKHGKCFEDGKELYTYQTRPAEDCFGYTDDDYDNVLKMLLKGLTTISAECVIMGVKESLLRKRMNEAKIRCNTMKKFGAKQHGKYFKHSGKVVEMYFEDKRSFISITRAIKIPMFAVRSIVADEITSRKQ